MRATRNPPSIAMSVLMLAVFSGMTGIALAFYPEGARAQPLLIGLPAIALCLLQLVIDLRGQTAREAAERSPPHGSSPQGANDSSAPIEVGRELRAWAWFLALIATVLLAGFWIAVPLFLVAFLRFEASSGWSTALGLGLGASAALYGLFGLVLRASLHDGFLVQWLRG